MREVVVPVPDLSARHVPDLDVASGERRTGWAAVEVFDLPRWAAHVLPLGGPAWAFLRLLRRHGVLVELPVTRRTARRRRAVEAVAVAALAGGAASVAAGTIGGSSGSRLLGLVLLVAGALAATVGVARVWVRGSLEDAGVRLIGAHRAFADGVDFVRALGRPPAEERPPLVRAAPPRV